MLHELKIINGQIHLDDFKAKGVKKYELKSSAKNNTAELTLKMIVKESELLFNHCADHTNRNLG